MIKADSVRDWGEQLEMPRKIETLVNILDLYCSHGQSIISKTYHFVRARLGSQGPIVVLAHFVNYVTF